MKINIRVPHKPIFSRFDLLRDTELLGQYLVSSEVNDFISEINQRYSYFSELQEMEMPLGLRLNVLWMLIRLFRISNRQQLILLPEEHFTFQFNITPEASGWLHETDVFLTKTDGRQEIIPSSDRGYYLSLAMMNEAVESVSISGSGLSKKAATAMLKKGQAPESYEEKKIWNLYHCIKLLSDLKEDHLTPDLLRRFHKMVTHGTLDDPAFEGSFRDFDDPGLVHDSTGERIHKGTSVYNLEKIITAICRFANESGQIHFMHPVVKASILYFLISWARPFSDANGRTARIVYYWYLYVNGYTLVPFISVSEEISNRMNAYARSYLYSEFDQLDLTYFINFQLLCLHGAFQTLRTRITDNQKQLKKWEKKELGEIFNRRQLYLINQFNRKPELGLSVNEARIMFSTVYETARTDMVGLQSAGLLKRTIESGKKIVFYRSEKFEKMLGAK